MCNYVLIGRREGRVRETEKKRREGKKEKRIGGNGADLTC